MYQLPIHYFYPLTEQIPLELDYKPCDNYWIEKTNKSTMSTILSIPHDGSITLNTTRIEPVFQIDVDDNKITVVSKDKPNLIKRMVYNALGMKWRQK